MSINQLPAPHTDVAAASVRPGSAASAPVAGGLTGGRLEARQALELIAGVLDRVDADRAALTPRDRLEAVAAARQVAGRVEALLCALVAEADAADASMRATGTPSSSWLALDGTLSKKESAGLLYKAKAVATHEGTRQAALAGQIGVGQARAIATVLAELPANLTPSQTAQAEATLLQLAETTDSAGLVRATDQILRTVAPAEAADQAAQRLQRQAEAAHRRRALTFARDHQGSVSFRGSLPTIEAEGWIAIIDSYTESARRNLLEERDPLAEALTPEQRRADALVAMLRAHQRERRAPSTGGDRPRIVVTVNYDRLRSQAVEAGLLRDGAPISAGDLRRLCCDADLLPAVMGGPSEVLDVGQERRLVTPGIRRALSIRDRGCVFPRCDTHPTACEAHHIIPWWAGGATALPNLVMLCHHHHALIEPDRYGKRDQWQVCIAADGIPEVIPPRRYDPERRPLRHQRFARGGGDEGHHEDGQEEAPPPNASPPENKPAANTRARNTRNENPRNENPRNENRPPPENARARNPRAQNTRNENTRNENWPARSGRAANAPGPPRQAGPA